MKLKKEKKVVSKCRGCGGKGLDPDGLKCLECNGTGKV